MISTWTKRRWPRKRLWRKSREYISSSLTASSTSSQLKSANPLLLSREQAAADDARNLKIAQDAVDGKLREGQRKRQKRGFEEADDSDSEDEDGFSRPKMEKKRRLDGDKLETLGKYLFSRVSLHPTNYMSSFCWGYREDSRGSCFPQSVPEWR